jgi:hypothetical protein
LQGLSSDDPVRVGPFPSRGSGRLRLMPMQRSHHRDMRHHRIAATLADHHQNLDRSLPFRRLFGFGQCHDVLRGVAAR